MSSAWGRVHPPALGPQGRLPIRQSLPGARWPVTVWPGRLINVSALGKGRRGGHIFLFIFFLGDSQSVRTRENCRTLPEQ
jgi:hypothetical protein